MNGKVPCEYNIIRYEGQNTVLEISEQQYGTAEFDQEPGKTSKDVLKIKVIRTNCLKGKCTLLAGSWTPEVHLAGDYKSRNLIDRTGSD